MASQAPEVASVWRRREPKHHGVVGIVTTVNADAAWLFYPRTNQSKRVQLSTFHTYYEPGCRGCRDASRQTEVTPGEPGTIQDGQARGRAARPGGGARGRGRGLGLGGELMGGHLGQSRLRLSANQLRRIADGVEQLEETGIDVREFRVDGMVVSLDRTDDQREGTSFYVTGITPEVSTSPSGSSTLRRDLGGPLVG